MNAPLHVAIAVLCGTTGGPATYGRRLVEALAAAGAVRLTVLTDQPDVLQGPGRDVVSVPMRGGIDRLRWQHWAVPRVLRKVRADLYHDTKNALPFWFGGPGVVTVHDLAYHTVPKTFGWLSRWFLQRATAHAVRNARAILVPSQATASDLLRIHPASAAKVHVVPHGIDPAPVPTSEQRTEVRRRLCLPEHYVLHVGTLQARKNVDLVVQGVRLLRKGGLPHRALLIGREGWLADRALQEIGRDDTAMWIPHVTDADLAAIYADAAAFVSPSAYEGFGFAVADALAAGVPTVIADISSLPELCGNAAVRLPALSGQDIATALRPLLTDLSMAEQLRQRGRTRAQQFTWRACAEGHVRAYHAAASQR